MKFISNSGLLALAGIASAFPAEMWEAVKRDPSLEAEAAKILEERAAISSADDAAKIFEPVPIFNAKEQFVSVSGKYAWVAPGPNDLRGPCPGLNAMANHGYLPHNGYATIAQFIDATTRVAGMGIQLATFLATYGAVIDGDLTAWSIGGTPPDKYLAIPPVAGKGNGISGSHNKYEGDASPMRPDLYQYGNDYKVRVQQYQQLMDLDPAPSNFDIPTLTKFRALRFAIQKSQNPYFFNGPFTGVLVQPAAYTFIYRFMANHTASKPEGVLNRNVLGSWFAITGTNNNYKWTPGYERIPENWYRRPTAYAYDNEYFLADVANAAKIFPQFLDIGGNTGTTNSFVGVNVKNLSGGVFNAASLSTGNNFACLAYQFAANAKPDVAGTETTGLLGAINTLTGPLTCPPLTKIDESQLMQFPGYSKSPAA